MTFVASQPAAPHVGQADSDMAPSWALMSVSVQGRAKEMSMIAGFDAEVRRESGPPLLLLPSGAATSRGLYP